jgi:hypothetical protein
MWGDYHLLELCLLITEWRTPAITLSSERNHGGCKEKVALVTGGTRGIGLGIALKLAEAGFTVAISGRREPSKCSRCWHRSRNAARRSIYMKADVASTADRQWLLATVESQLGRLDVLVNNAGIAPRVRADLLEAGEESFDELIGDQSSRALFSDPERRRVDDPQRAKDPWAAAVDHQYQFCLRHGGQREPGRLLHLQGRHRHGDQAVGSAPGGVRHRSL